MNKQELKRLEKIGIMVVCESPLEIEWHDSQANGHIAQTIIDQAFDGEFDCDYDEDGAVTEEDLLLQLPGFQVAEGAGLSPFVWETEAKAVKAKWEKRFVKLTGRLLDAEKKLARVFAALMPTGEK